MDEVNPYQSPAKDDESIVVHSPGNDRLHDAVIIVLAVLVLLVFGVGLTTLVIWLSQPPIILAEAAVITIWLSWVTKIANMCPSELVAGFILGRWLRRVRPGHVVVGIGLYLFVTILVLHGVGHTRGGWMWQAIGPVGVLIQNIGYSVLMLAIIAFGVRLGRKAKAKAAGKTN
jgi:hypothetical protein